MSAYRIDCLVCHGEGCLEELVPGGYFDMATECWHALERLVECPECGGAGSVEVDEEVWERAA